MENGVRRRLSQTLGQIKKGYVVDTFEGGFPAEQVTNAPDAQSNTAVLSATALTASAQVISGSITDPDVFRALRLVGNQADVLASVTVVGKDWADRTIQDTVTVSGTTPVNTNWPFKSVDQVQLPAQSAGGQTVSVGISNKLGLYRPVVVGVTALELLEVDAVVETEAALDTTYSTYTPTTVPNASRVYKANYLVDTF